MKPKSTIALVLGLAGVLGLGVLNASARLEVAAGVEINVAADFYTPLSTGGVWIDVDSYGRCWRPTGVSADWRPYCNGSWEWTDVGWYWVSNEPWAWACYHYGRWFYEPGQGWVWVPDVEWAPAWVSWRSGDDYIGWAPMGPRAGLFNWHRSEPVYVFVETRHFHDRFTPHSVIVNSTTLVNRTKVISHARQDKRAIGGASARWVVANDGPGVASIERATGTKMRAVSVVEIQHRSPAPAVMERRPVTVPERKVVAPPVMREPVREPSREVPHESVVRPVTPREPEHVNPAPVRPASPMPQPEQPRQPAQPMRPQQSPKTVKPSGREKAQPARPVPSRPANSNEHSGDDKRGPN